MEHYESRLNINGEWKTLLIIKSTEEQTFGNTLRFENSGIVEIYTVDSVFRTVQDEGFFYYWFIPKTHEFICARDAEARESASAIWDKLAEAYAEGVQNS